MTPWVRETVGRLVQDPLVLGLVKKMAEAEARGSKYAPAVRTPSQVVAEQRGFALLFAEEKFELMVKPDDEWTETMVRWILDASPVLWMNDIQHVAFQYNLPKHIVGEMHLPQQKMYWSFEGALPSIESTTGEETGILTDAWLLFEHPYGLEVAHLGTSKDKLNASGTIIKVGMRYPEDVSLHGRQILQAIAFINSPYVSLEKEWSKKPKAKAKFHGRRVGDPVSMHVVTLRSTIKEAIAVERGHGPQWKARWLVRGHYRAQWYPGSKTHKVIWIAPYIKGPADAELKSPVYAVVR